MEGLYLRTEAGGVVTGRAKFVRPEFVEKVKQSEHWQHRAMVPNRLDRGGGHLVMNWARDPDVSARGHTGLGRRPAVGSGDGRLPPGRRAGTPRGTCGRTRRWSAASSRGSTSGRRCADHERTVLLFTALFHDAGKPLTSQVDPATGRIASPKHALKGEHLARSVLRDLGCDLATREEVARTVRFHGRPAFLLEKARARRTRSPRSPGW